MIWPWLVGGFFVSVFLCVLVRRLASTFAIVDEPRHPRKIHREPTPLLGGLGIYATVLIGIILALVLTDTLTAGEVTVRHYVGFLLGGFVLMVGGALDDKVSLPPKYSVLFPLAASVLAILGGIEVDKLTNPFGGVVELERWVSNGLVFVWLMAVMYTTKLLDGLDGLATSVSSVGVLAILFLSATAAFFQPDVTLFAAIGFGALLGFLVWNWHPASLFLGEGGSTFVGYLLGVLAVISGGKLAIALLVLGIPLLDLVWVAVRRLMSKQPLTVADRKHLHHRLLNVGWSQSAIVLSYVGLSALFGLGALFLQSREKLFALLLLIVLMIVGALLVVRKERCYGSPPSTS